MIRKMGVALVVVISASGALAQDAQKGERSFNKCVACHAIGPHADNRIGPHLNGLDGRAAGAVPNFSYSDAVKKAGIVWTEASFKEFMSNPGGGSPATRWRSQESSPTKRALIYGLMSSGSVQRAARSDAPRFRAAVFPTEAPCHEKHRRQLMKPCASIPLRDTDLRPWSRRDAMTSMLSAVLVTGALRPGGAHAASDYPNKPVKLIVDSTPGGLTDLLARIAADRVTRSLGAPLIVENKAGANGRLAQDSLVRSPADGYTLLFCSNGSLFSTPFLDKASPIDPVVDLQGVFGAGEAPHLLVVPESLPVKTLSDFIAYAKAHPRGIFYGSAGIGSIPHISMSHLVFLAGIQAEHVAYKGLASAVADLLGGQLQAMVASLGTVRSYLKSGQLKALAVAAKRRLPSLPEVPTSAEAGLAAWQMSTWFGVFAPKRTSPDVLQRLNSALAAAFEDPGIKQKLLEMGVEPMGGSTQSFTERVRDDYAAYAKVIKGSRVKLE